MGLAASQARLLSLTARIHDVEYQAQMIQSAKLQLALQEDEVYRKYNEALDATTLTFQTYDKQVVKATFSNLCGEGSINNNIASTGSYIFRDGNGNVIVPSDIYDAYENFAGDDPYAFAMYMMCGEDSFNKQIPVGGESVSAFVKAETEYFNAHKNDNSEKLKSLKDSITKKVTDLYNKSPYYKEKDSENEEKNIQDMVDTILDGKWNDFVTSFFDKEEVDTNSDDFKSLKDTVDEYRHTIYRNGSAQIYEAITEDSADNFDQSRFNYYLKWGKILQNEVVTKDMGGATRAGSYQADIENDPELLNQMLESGRISIDLVYINTSTGKIGDTPTSVATDSVLDNPSGFDKAAVKKAEAEYEHAMKKIDQKDKRYDMDLSKLETERSALTTEYDSVKKVIQDNIDRTFKIFS